MSGFIHSRRVRSAAAAIAIALIGATALSACIEQSGGSPTRPPQTQQRSFNNPQVGGRWLDVCFGQGSCRERQAIDTFCRQQGFQRAVNSQSRVAGIGHQTVRIGDQSVCTNILNNCHHVTRVTCARTV